MKLLRIRLKNINSIQDEVTLDFENGPLSKTSLFAITGPTGSGKTTILDAISVALYHKTPRLDGKETRNPENLLSQSQDEGFSEVLFEVNKRRYLAEWRVRRSRSNKTSTSVKLIDADTQALLNDKKQQNPVPGILGLNFEAFCRSVLLAQGEFAAFLKAKAEEKRDLLENTTGIGFYDDLLQVLKDKFNDVEKNYQSLEMALINIEKSSEAEIKQTELDLKQARIELSAKQQKRDELKKSRAVETQRVENWKLLDSAKQRKTQLELQKSEIDTVEQAIQLANRAAELRPIQNTFDVEQANYQRLQENVKQAEIQLYQISELVTREEAAFRLKENLYQQEKDDSNEKFARLQLAAEEEIQAANLLNEANKRNQELNRLKIQIQASEKEFETKNLQKKQLDQRKEQATRFLAQHPAIETYKPLISKLNQDVASLREWERKREEVKKEGIQKNSDREQIEQQFNDNNIKINKQLEKRQEIIGQIDILQKELENLQVHGTEKELEDYRQKILNLQEVALNYENSFSQKREFVNQQKKLQGDFEKQETEIKINTSELGKVQSALEKAKNEISVIESKIEETRLTQVVLKLRQDHLQSDSPCPVCGAVEHPWAGQLEPEKEIVLANLEKQMLKTKKELESHQSEVNHLEQKKSALAAIREQFKTQIADIKSKIKQFDLKIDNYQNLWMPVLADKAISTQFIKVELANCETQLKLFRQQQEKIQKMETELLKLDAEIGKNRSLAEQLQIQIKKLVVEQNTRRDDYRKLSDEIKTLEQQILTKLPPENQKLGVEKGLHLLEESVKKVEEMEKELSRLNQDDAQLTTSMLEQEKQLNENKKRATELQIEINNYQDEGKAHSDRAREKTGGVSARNARENLEKNLKSLEEQKESAKKAFEITNEQLTSAKSRLQELNQQLQTSGTRFEKARQNYEQAIQTAGFENIEMYQQALKSPTWIKDQEQQIQRYHQNMFSVNEEIKRLTPEFEKVPFDGASLAALQMEESEIEQKIEFINNEIGKITEKLARQHNDFEKFKKLEVELNAAKTEYERWHKLHEIIGKNKLRDYALRSMFNLLIQYANHQMRQLTNRYQLKVKDMRDLVILDTWNAGEERPVETLSGGETFLTSLSLALALSELSKGRARLDALFLDEGFGTLDTDTLEIALDALEGLRLSGRTVGIISHVEELTRRVPVRIALTKRGDGSSTVEIIG
ncbi:AAA family ATPase [candidate division KSB1 bacterium]|nr:AAA family ATPase [candidate division KSB1 bacterium]